MNTGESRSDPIYRLAYIYSIKHFLHSFVSDQNPIDLHLERIHQFEIVLLYADPI